MTVRVGNSTVNNLAAINMNIKQPSHMAVKQSNHIMMN